MQTDDHLKQSTTRSIETHSSEEKNAELWSAVKLLRSEISSRSALLLRHSAVAVRLWWDPVCPCRFLKLHRIPNLSSNITCMSDDVDCSHTPAIPTRVSPSSLDISLHFRSEKQPSNSSHASRSLSVAHVLLPLCWLGQFHLKRESTWRRGREKE